MEIAIYVPAAALILWSVYGYFGSRVEQAAYSIVTKKNKYEIRNYPAHIVAQTTVSGSYEDSLKEGFRIVAEYIFGGNTKKEKIAMTAPVMAEEKVSEKIAMTAPLLVSNTDGQRVISFGMPASYTLETLPTPNDSRVHIVEVPDRRVAAISFAGYRTNARIQAKEKELLRVLHADGVDVIGTPSYAGYNAPFTPPWMTRHEVLIEVKMTQPKG